MAGEREAKAKETETKEAFAEDGFFGRGGDTLRGFGMWGSRGLVLSHAER